MKLLSVILLILPSISLANICSEIDPLQTAFQEQTKWQKIELSEFKTDKRVTGYVDGTNSLHLESLTGKHDVEGGLTLPLGKKGNNFKKACQRPFYGAKYLRSLRLSESGNLYTIKGQYFPKIQGIANNPFSTFDIGSLEVEVDYSANALVNKDEDSYALKSDILSALQKQLGNIDKNTGFAFELKNLDDFACDVASGNAKISVYLRMASNQPLVKEVVEIAKPDVLKLYSEWALATQKTKNREEAFFMAGLTFKKLEQEQQLSKTKPSSVLKLAQKVIPEGSPTVDFLGANEIQCLASSMTQYEQRRIQHRVKTNMIFDKALILNGSL